MAKGQSPLLGYNTNVRHKGRVYHIQTEDSGVARPHVITHLFADGGRILKSNKTSYTQLLEAPDLQVQVKKIMQDQHKAMFIALRDGQFDHLIDPADTTQSNLAPPPAAVTAAVAASAAAAPPVAAPVTASRPAVVVPPPAPSVSSASLAAVATKSVVPAPPATVAAPAAVAAPADGGPASSAPGPTGNANRSGRYAPVRAPEILGSFKSKPESASIFGDGLMSEKSLDEVILAYLAEDLDDKKR